MMTERILIRKSFPSEVTIFAHIFLIFNSSCRFCLNVSLLLFTMSSVIFWMFPSVYFITVRLERDVLYLLPLSNLRKLISVHPWTKLGHWGSVLFYPVFPVRCICGMDFEAWRNFQFLEASRSPLDVKDPWPFCKPS